MKKVYLNEKLLERGEERDYEIDYDFGRILFTNKNLINSGDNIFITFEYISNLEYRTDFIETEIKKKFFDSIELSSGFYRLNEKYSNIYFPFISSDDLQKMLEDSDEDELTLEGAILSDSLKGNYDRYYDAENDIYYFEYNSLQQGQYNAYFNYVGENKGSYISENNYYKYVGPSKGDFSIYHKIPLPQKRDNFSFDTKYVSPSKNIHISNQHSLSFYDKNNLNDKNNSLTGNANRLNALLKSEHQNFNIRWIYNREFESIQNFFSEAEIENYSILDEDILENLLDLRYQFDFKDNSISSDYYFIKMQQRKSEIANLTFSRKKRNYNLKSATKLKLYNGQKDYFSSRNEYNHFFRKINLTNNLDYIQKDILEDKKESLLLGNQITYFLDNFQVGLAFNGNFYKDNTRENKILLIKNTLDYYKKNLQYKQEYSLQKDYSQKQNYYNFSNTFRLLNLKNLNSFESYYNFSHVNTQQLFIEYVFVGEGNGDYSLDTFTNTYYPDEQGDYEKKEYYGGTNTFQYDLDYHTYLDLNLDESLNLYFRISNNFKHKNAGNFRDLFWNDDYYDFSWSINLKKYINENNSVETSYLERRYFIAEQGNQSENQKGSITYSYENKNRHDATYSYELRNYASGKFEINSFLLNNYFGNKRKLLLEYIDYQVQSTSTTDFYAKKYSWEIIEDIPYKILNFSLGLKHFYIDSDYFSSKLPYDISESASKDHTLNFSLKIRNRERKKFDFYGKLNYEINRYRKPYIYGNINMVMYF